MLPALVALIPVILGFVVLYFVVKAAVEKALLNVLWNMEISTRTAVRNGIIEAFQLMGEDEPEAETEEEDG